ADVPARPVDLRAPTVRLGSARPAVAGGDRDVAQRGTGQGTGTIVGPSPLPDAAPCPADRGGEGPAARQPVRPGPPAEGAEGRDGCAHLGAGDGVGGSSL